MPLDLKLTFLLDALWSNYYRILNMNIYAKQRKYRMWIIALYWQLSDRYSCEPVTCTYNAKWWVQHIKNVGSKSAYISVYFSAIQSQCSMSSINQTAATSGSALICWFKLVNLQNRTSGPPKKRFSSLLIGQPKSLWLSLYQSCKTKPPLLEQPHKTNPA